MKKLIDIVTGGLEEKKEYKKFKKRINKLPENYKTVFEGIETYMWNFANDGSMLNILYDVLYMFEEGVNENKKIENIIGTSVSEFCDNLLKEFPEKTWTYDIKTKIDKKVIKKINKKQKNYKK